MISSETRAGIADLILRNAHFIDAGSLDDWAGCFAEGGCYLVTTRETVDLGLDVGFKAAGAPVTVAASGLLPNSPVQIIVYSDPQILATVQTDDAGNANVTAEIPSDLPEGAHTLVVQAIGPEGTPVQSMGAMQLNDEGVVTAVAPPADATGLAPGDEAMTRALAAGKPVYDAQGHPVTVAAVAAAGAAVVAVAGAAGAAAAGASGAAGGGHAGGGSSGGGSSGSH